MDGKFDNRLFSILEEVKSLPNFLDVMFGFLYRRTDYFQVSTEPNLGIGLPKGVAQKLLMQAYQKYEVKQHSLIPEPIKEEIVTTQATVKTSEHVNVKKTEKQNTKSNESLKNDNDVQLFDCYNGAVFENYAWSQSITDLDIQIKIPDKITSKQLHVNITSGNMLLRLKNSDAVYLEGELCKKCKVNETVWSLDGHILQIHLEKASESWWDCLLQTEPRLDFNKMDCSRPFHELSEEARAKIEQLTWDQERRQQGLPTSEQINLERTLQKAWNVEGSPFTGEFDPSKVSL